MPDRKRQTPGLSRALWRARLTNRTNWAAAAVLILTLALLALFLIRVPASVTYLTARIDATTFAQTDYGGRPVYAATGANGQSFPRVAAAPRSQTALSSGDTICLRVQTDRFTGRVTAQHAPEHPGCTPSDTTK